MPPIFTPPPTAASSSGGLQLSSSQMDFGPVEHNGPKPTEQYFNVTSSGWVQVSGSERWIIPLPSTITGSGTVTVSVETTQLKPGTVIWHAPDLIRPVVNRVRRSGNQAWWAALLIFLIAVATPGGRQAITLVIGGWLSLHIMFWSTARVLRRLGFQPAELRGQLNVTDGVTQTSIGVRVKAVPSRWEMIVGWGGTLLVVGTLLMTMIAVLQWLTLNL